MPVFGCHDCFITDMPFFSSQEKDHTKHKESGIEKGICKGRDGSSREDGNEYEYEYGHAHGKGR